MRHISLAVFLALGVGTSSAGAQQQTTAPAQGSAEEQDVSSLAKTTQNPVGDVVSVPFQFNFNNGGGLGDETHFNLNIQPVIPIHLSQSWTLIARTILPLDSFPGPDLTRFTGTGNIQEQLFFTPARPDKIIWGLGPMLSLPTATAAVAKTGSWAAGPGGLLLKMTGPWVIGALAQQYWPFSDTNGSPETNLFVLQWFVNYNFGKGWALAAAPLNTANWDAESGQQWTVPLGLGITRTLVFNGQPMTLGVQYYRNLKRPDNAPANQLRFILSLIFPTRKGK
jgi:hypothetical protein